MNHRRTLFCIALLGLWHCISSGCPSCVGTINNESEPFFSDECYQTQKMPQLTSLPPINKEENHE